jgi:hypothetical protein
VSAVSGMVLPASPRQEKAASAVIRTDRPVAHRQDEICMVA